MSVSAKGFVNRDLHVETLKYLDIILTAECVDRPVWLFIDGASPHINLKALSFCKKANIQQL